MANKNKLLLHRTTWLISLAVIIILCVQLYIIGPYYWTGAPLLQSILLGTLIAIPITFVCEWRMHTKNKLSKTSLILMGIAFIFIFCLNLIPRHGTHESIFYGFPNSIYMVQSMSIGGTFSGSWDLKEFLANFGILFLSVLGIGLLCELVIKSDNFQNEN